MLYAMYMVLVYKHQKELQVQHTGLHFTRKWTHTLKSRTVSFAGLSRRKGSQYGEQCSHRLSVR